MQLQIVPNANGNIDYMYDYDNGYSLYIETVVRKGYQVCCIDAEGIIKSFPKLGLDKVMTDLTLEDVKSFIITLKNELKKKGLL